MFNFSLTEKYIFLKTACINVSFNKYLGPEREQYLKYPYLFSIVNQSFSNSEWL